jgi:hypothetical protein
MWASKLKELCLKEGVAIFYDTRVCALTRCPTGIDALIVENKSGRFAIGAAAFADATGDADLAFLTGAPTESLSSNVRAGWGYFADGAGGTWRLVVSAPFNRDASPSADDPYRYRGDDGREVSAQTIDSRALLRESWARTAEKKPGAELVRLSELPGFRMTRRLVGADTISYEQAHAPKSDAVGFFPNWHEAGPVWALSYGSLYSPAVLNLACAGRCLSASGAAWDLSRAIPVCSLSGEVAGIAAAMVAEAGTSGRGGTTGGGTGGFPAVDLAELRRRLAEKGNLLDPTLLEEAAAPVRPAQ